MRIMVTMRRWLKANRYSNAWRCAPTWAGIPLLVLVVFVVDGSAESHEPGVSWLSGQALDRAISRSPITVDWSGPPLRSMIDKLAEQAVRPKRLAIMLDRRVDPDRVVKLKVDGVPLGELLDQLAEQHELEIGRVGDVVYVGPKGVTTSVAKIAADRRRDLRAIPKPRQRVFQRRRESSWKDLASPRQLIQQMAVELGIEVDGLKRIPHDLWPAVRLPALTLADRLTLVLYGFDLTYAVSADGLRLEIVPAGPSLSQ